MADSSNTNGSLIPFKAIEEANQNLIESPPQAYDDLINTLPLKLYGPRRLRLYRGFWISELFLQGALTMQDKFKSRPSDLFLASYPKSGTTWLKALIFATLTRTSYPLDQHPLLANNPHQCVAYLDLLFSSGRKALVEAIPSPRILSTHLPHSVLPDSISSSDCKIIYICRDPKDALVSQYHFLYYDQSRKGADLSDEIFEMFREGSSPFGPIWDHVLGYWQDSLRRPENVLFLKYEEMLQEPTKHLKRLAEFIRCPFSETEEKQGMVEQIVELCSFEKLKNLDVNKTTKFQLDTNRFVSHAAYFRKGAAGDWRNHMTREMAQQFDDIAEEKFRGTGLAVSSEPTSSHGE